MILGRSVVHWLIVLFVCVCVFVLAKWLIPLLFGMIGFPIPDQIVIILSLLIALGCFYGGWSWRSGPVA